MDGTYPVVAGLRLAVAGGARRGRQRVCRAGGHRQYPLLEAPGGKRAGVALRRRLPGLSPGNVVLRSASTKCTTPAPRVGRPPPSSPLPWRSARARPSNPPARTRCRRSSRRGRHGHRRARHRRHRLRGRLPRAIPAGTKTGPFVWTGGELTFSFTIPLEGGMDIRTRLTAQGATLKGRWEDVKGAKSGPVELARARISSRGPGSGPARPAFPSRAGRAARSGRRRRRATSCPPPASPAS